MSVVGITQNGPKFVPGGNPPPGTVTVGTVAGSGTLNYLTKWSPDNQTIANSQWRDDATTLGLNNAPVTGVLVTIKSKGSTSATYAQRIFDSTGTALLLSVRDDGFVGIGNVSTFNLLIGTASVFGSGIANTVGGVNSFTASTTANNCTGWGYNVLRDTTSAFEVTAYGSQAGRKITTGTYISVGGSLAGAELTTQTGIAVWGASSFTNGTASYTTILGSQSFQAVLTGNYNVGAGWNIGNLMTSASRNNIVGSNTALAIVSGIRNQIWGTSAYATGNFSDTIVMGDSAQPTASNQWVVGSTDQVISDLYIGRGVEAASPTGITIHATGGSLADTIGANITIAGGAGRGTGTPGFFLIQTT